MMCFTVNGVLRYIVSGRPVYPGRSSLQSAVCSQKLSASHISHSHSSALLALICLSISPCGLVIIEQQQIRKDC
jgi:hypothetical protein